MLLCKHCGSPLIEVENTKYNDTFNVKKDFWQCCKCNRSYEEVRKSQFGEYK